MSNSNSSQSFFGRLAKAFSFSKKKTPPSSPCTSDESITSSTHDVTYRDDDNADGTSLDSEHSTTTSNMQTFQPNHTRQSRMDLDEVPTTSENPFVPTHRLNYSFELNKQQEPPRQKKGVRKFVSSTLPSAIPREHTFTFPTREGTVESSPASAATTVIPKAPPAFHPRANSTAMPLTLPT
jgi:hypothetical protein